MRASKEEEYNIFFLIFALSGHLFIQIFFIRVQEYNINVPGHTEGTGKYIGLPGHQEELLLLAGLGGALALVLVLVVVEAIPGQVRVS